MGATSRLASTIFPQYIPLHSNHVKFHWLERVLVCGEALARDSLTELLNQWYLQRDRKLKHVRSFNERIHKNVRAEHTHLASTDAPRMREASTTDFKTRVKSRVMADPLARFKKHDDDHKLDVDSN